MINNSDHENMISVIESEAKYTASYTGRERFSDEVMQAMREVPRNLFIPEESVDYAFDNGPLPIGFGQTISQPYIVALMTDLLELKADSTVLEIGTGSGYQTAILSQLAKSVFSIERIDSLCDSANRRLKRLGYKNIYIKCGDGYDGWPENAPYDAIIVTAASRDIPLPLIGQLKPGGRMVIPVGPEGRHQELVLVTKAADGSIDQQSILGVSFVPLIYKDK